MTRTAAELADWELLTADLAAASPLWRLGTAAAEHALTYGHYVTRRLGGFDRVDAVIEALHACLGRSA